MSDIYTTLGVSPRKKRRASPGADEAIVLTPKRIRTRLPTPPSTVKRKPTKEKQTIPLPANLSRLLIIQTTLQQALSHALASCALSPSSDTGIVRDVLTHISLTNYSGLSTTFEIDDLRRICWLWEWDGKKVPTLKEVGDEEEDNPFLDMPEVPTPPKDWSRGGMGFVVTSTTHFTRSTGTRVPAYGIGIEVEIDIDKDMGGGMAAVARWTTDSESRKTQFKSKLEKWLKLYEGVDPCPNLPKADLPELPPQPKTASLLTKMFASSSPKSAASAKILSMPQSPSPKLSLGSPKKSPAKQLPPIRPFNLPFPTSSSSSLRSPTKSPNKTLVAGIFPKTPGKNSVLFPQTPSSHHSSGSSSIFSPRTPRSSLSTPSTSIPSTPSRQKGDDADTVPATPTTARRQALYERIRQKSITNSPVKHRFGGDPDTPKMSRDQLLKLSQEETRRKCLLGRLGGVAESIWMLFSGPAGSTSATPSSRKRRALPLTDISAAIVKSSAVPISGAEAIESVNMLTKLCPFFIKSLNVDGEEWFEMPSSAVTETDEEKQPPPSPSARKGKGREMASAEVLIRSPKRVRKEGGGLREVRERIRRELDQD